MTASYKMFYHIFNKMHFSKGGKCYTEIESLIYSFLKKQSMSVTTVHFLYLTMKFKKKKSIGQKL